LPESPTPTCDPVAEYLRARAVKENFQARTTEPEYKDRAEKLIEAVILGPDTPAAAKSAPTPNNVTSRPR
jgi:hypothetical protein